MTSDGRFIYRVVESGNRTTFLEFLKYNVMREFPNHKYLLMDNARIHHCKEIKEFILKKGKVPVYTVPYTPELNPIENGFSVLTSINFFGRNRHLCKLGVDRVDNN